MMNLCCSAGAHSLSPYIVLREAGLPFELKKADPKIRQVADGSDFSQINGNGDARVLEHDNGRYLTEGPVK